MNSRRWTYEAAVDHILSFVNYEALNGRHPMTRGPADLRRFSRALSRLGHPERIAPAVHVAGTNGKGSTAAIIASLLAAEERRVGLYTSPHLVEMSERIRVNGRPIGRAAFARAAARAAAVVDGKPGAGFRTTFEILTALAFIAFREKGVDALVIEVGLGGRLDSTNVLNTRVAAITPIGLDHTEVLGSRLSTIAADKAGILKRGAAAVSARQSPAARAALERRAAKLGVDIEFADTLKLDVAAATPAGEAFSLTTPLAEYPDLTLPLRGAHQVENAALAIRAAEHFLGRALNPVAARAGLKAVRWPGRFQVLSRRPPLVVDGAHNPAGAAILGEALERHFPGRKVVFALGVSMGKDLNGILDALSGHAAGVVAVRSAHARGESPEVVARAARSRIRAVVEEAKDARSSLVRARRLAGRDGVVCVAGSLYLVGDVLKDWGAFRSSWEGKAPRVHHR